MQTNYYPRTPKAPVHTPATQMGLSAVHQLQSPQKPHLYNHSHQLKMVDTNEQQPPTSSGIAVPCLCKDYVPAVKVSKMRVFKKIKKKIGLSK